MTTMFYVITCILIGMTMGSGMFVFGFIMTIITDTSTSIKESLMTPVWGGKKTKSETKEN